MASIRVIVSFVTDQLYRLRNIKSVDRLSFYEKMLTDFVGLTKASLSTVQFTCTYLNIARQLEQHHLDQLFPLPLRSEDSLGTISVKDLFHTAVNKGSLPVASSSLPLPIFESTETLHQHCLQLLHHCISAIFDFLAKNDSMNLWCIREECFFLQQIYNYTMKLEDSFDAQQVDYGESFDSELYNDESFDVNDEDAMNTNDGVDDSRFSDKISEESDEPIEETESYISDGSSFAEIEIKEETKTPSRMRRIASALKPLFSRANKNKDDERAIAEAASTFVLSGFEDNSIHIDSMHDEFGIASPGSMILENSMSADDSYSAPKHSSSEILGKAITLCALHATNAIHSEPKTSNPISHIAVLCNLLQSNYSDKDYEIESFLNTIKSIPDEAYTDLSKYFFGYCDDYTESRIIFITKLAETCSEKWSSRDAETVLDVILTIVARNKGTVDTDYYLPVLVIIATISCNISMNAEKLRKDERFASSYVNNCLIHSRLVTQNSENDH